MVVVQVTGLTVLIIHITFAVYIDLTARFILLTVNLGLIIIAAILHVVVLLLKWFRLYPVNNELDFFFLHAEKFMCVKTVLACVGYIRSQCMTM